MLTVDDIDVAPLSASHDIVMLGAGLSSTYTLIQLCKRLQGGAPALPVHAVVIEKTGDFFGGIPYGLRSGANSLIITPLNEFLPEQELELFQRWLRTNADTILDDFEKRTGPRSTEWLSRAGERVRRGDCADLHVPRYLWGRYLTDTVARLAGEAIDRGDLRLSLVTAEATGIVPSTDPSNPSVTIETDRTAPIVAQTALLGLGMPPTRKLFGRASVDALLIEEPYAPDLDATVDRIADSVLQATDPRIAIIGANAGSLEMLYMLGNHPVIEQRGATIEVLSPQGRLPERYNEKADPRFAPTHLPALTDAEDVTANDILKAVELDLADARSSGLGISDSLPTISAAVGSLLPLLSRAEMEAFVAHPGVEIGRLQRRAGDEYCDAAEDLANSGRLTVTTGRFTTVSSGHEGANVHYVDADEIPRQLEGCTVVVNCAGSGGLEIPNQSHLLQSMLETKTFRSTASGHGLKVNDDFEASPGIYVNGPLLAGNVVNGNGIWHVEHCGRIINFSDQIAEKLLSVLRP